MPGPLANIRVVEMGTLYAGPLVGQLLGDMGAEVIKIEPPEKGDPMRKWGHKLPKDQSLWFPVVSRNKKSVTINLRAAEGQKLARRLISTADILTENFRPGTLERWGLDYESLSADNPGLIMVRVTGYGQTGPYSSWAGFGSIGEAMGGLRYITGDPQTPTSRTGISIGDAMAGTMGTIGALGALHHRENTGEGQVVDTSLVESVLSYMESLIPEYQFTGYVRERTGGRLPNVAPSNSYPTRDGEGIIIAANQDSVFQRLCELMGRPELPKDPRFADHVSRGENYAELDEMISEWTKTMPAKELYDKLGEAGVPAGFIYTAPDMLEDQHFQARSSIIESDHPVLGPFKMQAPHPKLSRTPAEVRWVAPQLGEHNEEVFEELGYSRDELEHLRETEVI